MVLIAYFMEAMGIRAFFLSNEADESLSQKSTRTT